MKQLAIIISMLMLAKFAAQGAILNPIDYKDTEKAYNDYVGFLKQHDVYITLPQGYSPANIRGLSDVKTSIGSGEEEMNLRCNPIDIEAIVEEDSCKAAICYPQIKLDIPRKSEPVYLSRVHGSRNIEADLRMIHKDMHLDVRPFIKIIVEEDMSQYSNADTVAIYEFPLPRHFMDIYTQGIGIYLRKKNHPAILLRVMYNPAYEQDKDKLIRAALDNIRFGDNPSDTFVELEKKEMGYIRDFNFPSTYPGFTGILADINDETLDMLNKVKAWCEEHGMKELPKVDDDMLEALNRHRESQRYHYTLADSILNSDLPEDKKILKPFMCDSHAQFPGDEDFMNKYWEWLEKNMIYPKKALEKGVEGSVLVNFTVCTDGSIKDIAINKQKGRKPVDESLEQEAIRLFESMPRWTPATYKGKPVNSRELRTVTFKLPQNKSRFPESLIVASQIRTDKHKPATKQIAEERRVLTLIYDMQSIPVAPIFKGGSQGLEKWIQEHLQYPADAAKAKIEGRVIVEFVIDKNGAVTSPRVVRGINDAFNNEALRVIKSLPRWTPGYAHGKPANTRYTYPVTFRLAKAK
ncbi:MAG: energy transducer TonB [Muribaculaceae bacterium]|nr:energy transducer TonB [Muribaculaceae bacterium]